MRLLARRARYTRGAEVREFGFFLKHGSYIVVDGTLVGGPVCHLIFVVTWRRWLARRTR